MVIVPNSDIYLLKVPITLDGKNQLNFPSKEAQFAYFSSLPKVLLENATYQRKNGSIRFPDKVDDIINYNYVMYQNTNYSDKWFYAFILGMRYVNDSMTEIIIQTDVWQTWQFDLNIKPSFVEREMINPSDDIPR